MKQLVGLNSLRFIGFLAIFICHTSSYYEYGFQVVSYFFVLSSFLLFHLALTEIEITGWFSKKNFFIRRSLRIFPLYFLALLLGFVIAPLVANYCNYGLTPAEHPFYYLVFLSNYDFSDHLFALKFLWSIAVEEQFYLLFLVLSPLFHKHFWIMISILIITYISYVIVANEVNLRLFTQLPFHLINFSAGMIAAWGYKKKQISNRLVIFIMFGLIALAVILSESHFVFNASSSFAFATLIIVTIRYSEKFNLVRFTLFRWLEKLGNYTYGMYVYSGFAISFGVYFINTGNFIIDVIVELLITVVVSVVSYHFYESYFLSLKHQFLGTKKG